MNPEPPAALRVSRWRQTNRSCHSTTSAGGHATAVVRFE